MAGVESELLKRVVRVGLVAAVSAIGAFAPKPDAGQLINQALNNLRNPEKSGQAGEFSTHKYPKDRIAAAEDNRRLYIAFVTRDGPPLPPIDLRMNVDPGVPTTVVQYTSEGINASRTFMFRHFGFNLGILTVNLKNDKTQPQAAYGLIVAGVLGDWWSPYPMGRRNTAAHEVGHQLQYFLTDNLGSDKWGDWWLQEGIAQYIADESLTEAGYYPNNQQRACQVLSIVRVPVNAPLRQMDSSNPNLPVWSIASLAVKDMVEQFGDSVIPTYLSSVGNRGTEEAFRIASRGVNINDFANQFDQKRRQLAFPGDTYRYWAAQDPCAGI